MPDDARLSQLLEVLQGQLSQERLELLAKEFGLLAQDRPQTLVFFVLQNVCQRLVSALEGEGVSFERFQELNGGNRKANHGCPARPAARKSRFRKARTVGGFAVSEFGALPQLSGGVVDAT